MTQQLYLSIAAQAVINAAARAGYPNEICGFLYGSENETSRFLEQAIPIVNSKTGDQRRRFEISPLDYLKAEQYALENDTQLLGIYHSHPDHPAQASVHDLEKALPFFSYLIVSVRQGDIAETQSWRLYDEERKFYEENLFIDTQHKQLTA